MHYGTRLLQISHSDILIGLSEKGELWPGLVEQDCVLFASIWLREMLLKSIGKFAIRFTTRILKHRS